MRNFFQASEVVDAEEFYLFGQGAMNHYLSVHGLAWFPVQSNQEELRREASLPLNAKDRDPDIKSLSLGYVVSKYQAKITEDFDIMANPLIVSALKEARDTGQITLLKHFSDSISDSVAGTHAEEKDNDCEIWAISPMYNSWVELGSVEIRRRSWQGVMLTIFNLGEFISNTLELSADRDPWVQRSHMIWWRDRPSGQANSPSNSDRLEPGNQNGVFLFYHANTQEVTKHLKGVENVNSLEFICRDRDSCTYSIQVANETWSIEFLPTREWLKNFQYWKIWMTLLLGLSTTGFLTVCLPALLGRQYQSEKQALALESQHQALIELKQYKMNSENVLAKTKKEADRIHTELKQEIQTLKELNQELQQSNASLKQINAEMMLVSNMTHLLQACVNEDEAYATISEFIEKLFPNQSGIIYLINDSKNLMEGVKSWGSHSVSQPVFSPYECWALRSGQAYLLDRSQNNLPCKHYDRLPEKSLEQSLCIPLVAQSDTLGMLYLESCTEAKKLSPSQMKLAISVGKHIGLALANLKLRKTLEHQSIRDPLTGLYNRRYLEEFLNQQIQRVRRNHQPFAVMMIDVDHFKQFNDTFGHDGGDRVLQELGGLLQNNLRGSDIACRYGGEELTLVLAEISWDNAKKRAEEIRQAIKALKVRSGQQLLGQITASFGVSLFPDDGLTIEALFEAADAALYRAKAQGRDRVVMASGNEAVSGGS